MLQRAAARLQEARGLFARGTVRADSASPNPRDWRLSVARWRRQVNHILARQQARAAIMAYRHCSKSATRTFLGKRPIEHFIESPWTPKLTIMTVAHAGRLSQVWAALETITMNDKHRVRACNELRGDCACPRHGHCRGRLRKRKRGSRQQTAFATPMTAGGAESSPACGSACDEGAHQPAHSRLLEWRPGSPKRAPAEGWQALQEGQFCQRFASARLCRRALAHRRCHAGQV